jgi:adhesin/invasin
VMRAAQGATDVMRSDGTDGTQRDESHKLDSGPGRGIFDYRDFMSISFRLPRSRARIWALPFVLGLGLSTYGCGDGGGDCGGPFCFGPEQPRATKIKLGSDGGGNGQSGAPSRELPQPLEVIVTDDDDKPIQDVVVSFSVGEGGGSLTGPEIRSDVQGRAQATWILGPEPGTQSAQATATATSGDLLKGAPLTFTAQAVRPPPAQLVLRQAPSVAARNGIPLEQQPIVEVLDSDDQPVPQVQVIAAIASGGGTLSGTTGVASDAEGRVVYSNLALVGPSGARTLRFSVVDPALEVVSGAIIVGAGGPSQITGVAPLTYQGTVGSPVSPAPSVVVKDAAGNPVPGISVSFTTDRDASISPETVNTGDNGVAKVTSWTLGTTANVQYTLTARVEGSTLTPVRFSAMARAGAAGRLGILAHPSTTTQNGLPFTEQPVIQVVDQNGNPTPQADVQITASIAAGPTGTLQNATATTDAGGRATFSGLTLTGAVGNYTISFSAQGLGGVMSNPIALSAGPATQLAFAVAPPATARSRAPLGPVIQLQDASGNPVAQAGISIVASVDAGTLAGLSTVSTGTDGRAAFTDLAIAGSPGPKTLTFNSTGLPALSAQVTLPDVARIEVIAGTPDSATVGTTLPAGPIGILKDVRGQPVADAPFTLTPATGTGTVSVSPPTGISGADGAVTADSWTLGTTAGDQGVEIKVSESVPSLTIHLVGTPAAPAQMQKFSGDSQSVSSPPATDTTAALPNPLVVRVTDQYGNGVKGVVVQWRSCDGAGAYDQGTDPDGFSSSRQPIQPAASAGTYCTRASASGVSSIDFTYFVTSPGSSMSQLRAGRPGIKTRGLPPTAPRPSGARRAQPR